MPIPKQTPVAGAPCLRVRACSELAATSTPTTIDGIMTAAIHRGLA